MRIQGCLHFACVLVLASSAYAQGANSAGSSYLQGSAPGTAPVDTLEFAAPRYVQNVDAGFMLAGHPDCGDDGTIYALISGYSPGESDVRFGRLAILGIHPDGDETRFNWQSPAGFTHVSPPESIFVGSDHVSVLVKADHAAGAQSRSARLSLLLTFNLNGTLLNTVVLDQDLSPSNVGVFSSGDILLVSEDRLNHRMALDVVDRSGVRVRRLQLGGNDFLARAAGSEAKRYSPELLIAMSKLYSWRGHLLLVPLRTSGLPILELSEHGVIASVVPQLPNGSIMQDFVPSDGPGWMVQLGSLLDSGNKGLDRNGNLLDIATRPSTRIAELSPSDGRLLREFDMGGSGMEPACETGGQFHFLTASSGGGRLQTVTATAR